MEARHFRPVNFAEQFRTRETIEFKEGGITVVDLKPEVMKDEVPVLLAPGWTENFETYKSCLEMMYDAGRRVISVDFSRQGGIVPKKDSYPQSELRKALQIIQVLRTKHLPQVDAIAHSEGAINTLMAASFKPSIFRNVVLDRPMGMVGEEEKLDLFKRWVSNRKAENELRPTDPEDPVSKSQVLKRTRQYILANPIRALGEGLRMTKFDAFPLLKKASDNGVSIAIIGGVDDSLSPADRQIQHLRTLGEPIHIAGYYAVTGSHNSISIRPEKYMAAAIDALNGLQHRRSTRR